MNSNYPLINPISVKDLDSLEHAKDRMADPLSIKELSFVTYEIQGDKLIGLQDILNADLNIYSLTIQRMYESVSFKPGKAIAFYSVTVRSTEQELDKMISLVQKIKDKSSKQSGNGNVADASRHNALIESLAATPLR